MNIIRLLHRLAGGAGAGSPATVAPSGVVAVNFDTGASTPELWASDGAAWKQLNPAGSVTYATSAEVITGTSTTAALNPAALAGAAAVVSAGAADAGKYIRLDAAGLADDTVIPKALATDITTGTSTDTFITPAALEAASVVASLGAADANKYVTLDANGKIDPSVLSVDAMQYKGGADVTAAAPAAAALSVGDVYYVTTGGTVAASWTGAAGIVANTGDMMIWNGTAFDFVDSSTDLSAYVPLAGTAGVAGAAMVSGAVITFNPAASGNVVLNGATGANFGALDKCIVDCGTF